MDLFRVETGAIQGQSCNEETMPMLKRSTRKDEPAMASKAFLVHDSLTCITNLTLSIAQPSAESKECNKKATSPVKQKDNKLNPPKSPEYCYLSPKNLQDPLLPNTSKAKIDDVPNFKKGDFCQTSKELLKDGIQSNQSSTILALVASHADQPSTSSAQSKAARQNVSRSSPPDSGNKKTLGELAKEWSAGQSPDQTKAEETKLDKMTADNPESDEELVRHSTFYSNSSSVHGMSSQECRLRNKLKTRRHLNRDEVYQERKNGLPPLVKLHGVDTE